MNLKKMYSICVLSLLAIVFAGCTKDEVVDENDGAVGEVNVNPNYVSVDWSSSVLLTSDDSTGTYRIQFNGEVPDIHPGSIITIDRDTLVRHIFVETVNVSGNTASITSSEAYLTDIFSDTRFTLSTSSQTKSSPKGAVFYPVEAYVTEGNGMFHPLDVKDFRKGNTRFTHNLWQFEYNNDGQVLFSGSNYSIYMEQMNLNLDLDLEMTLNFGGRTVHEVVNDAIERYRSNALSLNAALVGTFSTAQKVRCDVHGNCNYNPEYDLWKHNLLRPLTIRFVVAGVPIVITLRSDLFRQVELSASGEISAYTGFSDQAEGRLGFEWRQSGGMAPVASFENTFELVPPTVEGYGQVQAKVWAFPRVSVMLYDVVGPSFDFKPYITDTLRGGFRQQMLGQNNGYCAWNLDCHAGVDACCGLSFRFMGYEVENYSTPNWNIVDRKLYHSPNRIEHVSGRPGVGESQSVSFKVYDYNYLLNAESITPLPQLVKFEANGQLSSTYGVVQQGIVSVTWTPSENDVLYAKLYDINGNVISFDTVHAIAPNPQPSGDWVDLGLPSGLLWATRNIGAESPEDYGDYFAWGETQPKSVYSWSTYRYCNGTFDQLTKYCYNSSYGYNGFTDNLTTLQPSDDAATANWGNGWRTPTKEEWQELRDNTTSIWTTRNGVYGLLLTASNGNSFFLPAAGIRWGGELSRAGEIGLYWSASLSTDRPCSACGFDFSWDYQFMGSFEDRFGGTSVRAVRSAR